MLQRIGSIALCVDCEASERLTGWCSNSTEATTISLATASPIGMTSRLATPTRKKKPEIRMPDHLPGTPMSTGIRKAITVVTTIVMGKRKAPELTVSLIGPTTHVRPSSNPEQWGTTMLSWAN